MRRDGISVWPAKAASYWVFQVSYRDDSGQRRRIQRRANTKTEAYRRAQDLQRSLQFNANSVERARFDELLTDYTETMRHQVRPNTLATSVHLMKLYVSPTLGSKLVNGITVTDVSNLLNRLKAKGLTVGTVNTVRAKLHAIMQFALMQSKVNFNPVSRVRPLRLQQGDRTQVKPPWTLEEVKLVLKAFQGSFLEAFVLIALTTGMRKGEILGLQWRDIDFGENQIRVEKSRGEKRKLNSNLSVSTSNEVGPTKNMSSIRVLPLTAKVRACLEELREARRHLGVAAGESDFVVLGMGGEPISPSYLGKAIARTLSANGIRQIRIHDTRHTVAVLALEAGVPLEEISQGLGHSGIEITKKTYAPMVRALSDRFVNRMDQLLGE
jgi:integrase